MTDIVERLRELQGQTDAFANNQHHSFVTTQQMARESAAALTEATAEIERLRADNEFLKEGIEKHVALGIRLGERAEKAEAEIETLREQHELALLVHDKMAAEIERLRAAWDASIAERGELLAEIKGKGDIAASGPTAGAQTEMGMPRLTPQ